MQRPHIALFIAPSSRRAAPLRTNFARAHNAHLRLLPLIAGGCALCSLPARAQQTPALSPLSKTGAASKIAAPAPISAATPPVAVAAKAPLNAPNSSNVSATAATPVAVAAPVAVTKSVAAVAPIAAPVAAAKPIAAPVAAVAPIAVTKPVTVAGTVGKVATVTIPKTGGGAALALSSPRVILAQLTPDRPHEPAATPDDGPDGLRVPIGPETTPAVPNPPPLEPRAPVAPPQTVIPGGFDITPQLPPIIGDVQGAQGREISDVRVVGNRVILTPTILQQISLQPGSAFSANQADNDRLRIAQLGFFASVALQVAPDLSDSTKVTVTYIVVENRVVTGFKFLNNTSVKTEDLLPVVKSKIGSVLNFNTVGDDVTAIQDLYKQKGFAAVIATQPQQLADGTLVFPISEATISKITLTGLKRTREYLVRRQIRIKPGDTFSTANLRQDLNRLYDTNFFDSVEPDIKDDPNVPGSVMVNFVFREHQTGQFSVGVGFDSRSKLSGFVTLSENNLRGTGQRGFASVEVGAQRNFELGTGNPFIGDKNASYDVSIYQRSIFREPRAVARLGVVTDSNYYYEEQRTGGRVNFTQPLDYNRRRTIIYGYRNERARLVQRSITDFTGTTDGTTTDPGTSLDSNPLAAEGTVSAASVGFLHDSRDLRVDPSSGGRESIVVEQAVKFLGNTTFTKFDLDVRRYIPLMHNKVLGAPAKLVLAGRGVIGRSLNQLPTFEQYYIGGAETVRGYNTEQQYGDNQIYGNLELRYRFQPKITGVLFADAGTAYGGRISTSSSPDILTAYGLGVRLVTPIGPIRLDYGFGRNGARTSFGIGATF